MNAKPRGLANVSTSSAIEMPVTLPQPQTSGQFDLSRNVIASGGGASSGGSFNLQGTIGQYGVNTQMNGGQFALSGGFWQTESAGAPTPTPTPTPTPIPTPTPTPTPPLSVTIFVDQDNPNQAVALDSVTFVRGPFPIFTDHNLSADHHTRVILFTTPLGLAQPDPSRLMVTAGGVQLQVENVGTLTGIADLSASYIIVVLPVGLPPGNLSLSVFLNGVTSTNSPTLSISP